MAEAKGPDSFQPNPKLFSVSWKCPTLPTMSNFLPACWQGLGGEQRGKEGREEGLPFWRPPAYSGCNSCCVWGKVCSTSRSKGGARSLGGLWGESQGGAGASCRQRRGFCWSAKGSFIGLGRPLAAFAIPEIAT